MAKMIFGCGYLGARVARRWREADQEVLAVTRSARRAEHLSQLGLRPILADVTKSVTLPAVAGLDTVLFAVGFDRAAGRSIRDVYVGGLKNSLDALPDTVERFIYISSTGVYGQRDGRWVDEDSLCEPTREGGKACLAAEQLLAQHPLGRRAIVLRLAGIYGPQRIPNLGAINSGLPGAAPRHGYLNLIHVDDAASVVLAAETVVTPPRLFVVSDGCPVERAEFYRELARLLGAPPPRFEQPPSDAPKAQRAASSKRICSIRAQRELAVSLKYPTYREGLAAIVSEPWTTPEK